MDYLSLKPPMWFYVFVGMFQGLVSNNVEVYRTHIDAAGAFTRFCDVLYEDFAAGRSELSGRFEDSAIYIRSTL